MKERAILINTCRGKVVDGGALLKALNEGQIAGAGLDVLEKEPPDPKDPLLDCEKLIVTPHAAWYSEESLERLKSFGMDEVADRLSMYTTYFDRPELINEQLDRYLAVDAEAVREVCTAVFGREDRATITYVPRASVESAA